MFKGLRTTALEEKLVCFFLNSDFFLFILFACSPFNNRKLVVNTWTSTIPQDSRTF